MWLLYGFLFLLPFQFALNPSAGIDLALGRVLAAGLIGFSLSGALARKSFPLSQSPLSLGLCLFLLWAALSLLWAEDSFLVVRKLFFLANFIILFWTVPLLLQKKQLNHALLVYPAFLAALLGIGQFCAQFIIGLDKLLDIWRSLTPFIFGESFAAQIFLRPSWLVEIADTPVFRALGLFPDPHIFGFYLGLVIPLAFALPHNYARFLGSILVVALLLTFSRQAYIGGAAALVAFIAVSVKRKARNSREVKDKRNELRFIITLGIAALLGLSLLLTPIGARLLSSFNPWEGSNRERLANWHQGLSLVATKPLLGVGLGNYAKALDPIANERVPLYAHNLYLDIAAELGIVGLSLFLLIMGEALKKAWRQSPPYFFALLWFCVQSLFDTPLFSVHVLPLLIIYFVLIDAHKTA